MELKTVARRTAAVVLGMLLAGVPGYAAPLFGRPERSELLPAIGVARPVRQRTARPPVKHAAVRRRKQKPVVAHHYQTLRVCATAYALRGYTSRGTYTCPGTIAVDPRVIPFGTRIYVPGYGWGTALDTGGAIRGAVIDLWMPSTAACMRWGVRSVRIEIEAPPHRPWLASRGARNRIVRHRRRYRPRHR